MVVRSRIVAAGCAALAFGVGTIGHGADDWPYPHGDRDGSLRATGQGGISGVGDERPGVIWSIEATASSVLFDASTLFDVDGDPELEILTLNRGRLLAWDVQAGAQLWASPPLLMDGFVGLFDLDGDGDAAEAVTMSSDPAGGIYVVDARTGAVLWSAADYPHAAGVGDTETIAVDIDGDGAAELWYGLRYIGLPTVSLVKFAGPGVFSSPYVAEDEVTLFDNENQFSAGDFSGSGLDDEFVVPQATGFNHFRACGVADPGASCDPFYEVCVCLVAEYQNVFRGPNIGTSAVADWDGDGVMELLMAGGDSHENVTLSMLDFEEGVAGGYPDTTDLLLWQYDYGWDDEDTFSTTVEILPGSPVDVTGDGDVDVVVTVFDDKGVEIDHDGAPADDGIDHPDGYAVGVFDAESGLLRASILDAYAIGAEDFDGDGRAEIVVRPTSGDTLQQEVRGYELTCPGFNCAANLAWSYSGVVTDAYEAKPKSARSQDRGQTEVPPFVDLEGDGDPEILAIRSNTSLYALDVSSGGTVSVERSRVVGACNKVGEVIGSGSSMRILMEGGTCLAVFDSTLTQIGASVTTLPLQGKVDNLAVSPRASDPAYPIVGGSLYLDPSSGDDADHSFTGTVDFAADLDGDGIKEVVTHVNDDNAQSFTVQVVSLDLADGDGDGSIYETRWTFDSETEPDLDGFTLGPSIAMADAQIDGDAAREIVMVGSRNRNSQNLVLLALDGRTGSLDWVSEPVPESRQGILQPGIALGIADVATSGGVIGTPDGRDDIVLASSASYDLFAPPTTASIDSEDHPSLYVTGTIYADFDDDGDHEMLLAGNLASVNAKLQTYEVIPALGPSWDFDRDIDLATDSDDAFAAIDANSEGGVDIAFADSRGALRIYDGASGDTLPGFPVYLTDGEMWGEQQGQARSAKAVAVADVDHDGHEEVLVGVDDGYLYALDVAEGEVGDDPALLWSLFVGTRIWSIHPADVDDDGEIEVLVASDDGHLHAVDGTPAYIEITEPDNDACVSSDTFPVEGIATGIEEVRIEANYATEDEVSVVLNQWEGMVSLPGEGTFIITAVGLTDGIEVATDAINVTYTADHDGDGWTPCEGDCNDADPAIHPGAIDLCDAIDQDCDGVVANEPDADGDGWRECEGDCNDGDPAVNPGATEVCNGIDDDCNFVVDDVPDLDGDGVTVCDGDCDDLDPDVHPGAPDTCDDVVDNDCDGVADPGETDSDGDGFTPCDGDCDDTDPDVLPGGVEVCNGVDDDCDGAIDESTDGDGDGWDLCEGDCDDSDPDVHPGAPELCNGADDDCDGLPDDSEVDADGDGYTECDGDCDDSDADTWPGGTETCDGEDDDCDGAIDESIDADGDGWDLCEGDCDDLDPAVHPGAPEVCDGAPDNNCDGVLDPYEVDGDGDGVTVCEGDCDDGNPDAFPGATEACDGVDNDCDGAIDEVTDDDGDGWDGCEGDCDDHDPAVYPGAPEVCDGAPDNDCDGVLDPRELDADGDGVTGCAGDCNDADATIWPGAAEVCDGKDQGCDTVPLVDEGTECFDDDGDGLSEEGGDCDDADPAVVPGAGEVCDGVDGDCDGVVDDGTPCVDDDGDGFTDDAGDCHDGDAGVHPAAIEVCNGLDDDCDGTVDEGTACSDDDGDGFTENAGDCDDGDAGVWPGAPETCDFEDQDCDGTADEGTACYDDDGDGFTEAGGDCNDGDPDVHPDAIELDNGFDDDCDGLIDGETVPYDGDGDGYTVSGGDCDDADDAVFPDAPEVCDGVDQDCDGVLDEGTGCSDDDGDGFSEDQGDCVDSDDQIHPGAPEVADGVDQDCDGEVDEGTDTTDDDGDGFSESGGDCDDADGSVFPGAPETADGADNDCDGLVDEGTDAFDDDDDGFTEADGDCDDGSGWTFPEAKEACDGMDNDCDGTIDEGCAGAPGGDEDPGSDPGGCNCDAGSAPGRGGASPLAALVLLAGLGRRGRRMLLPAGRGVSAVAGLIGLALGVGCTDVSLITDPASIEANPDLLDFGDVATGDLKDRDLFLDNVGDGSATITSSAVLDDPEDRFEVVEEYLGDLASGGTATMVVRYAPDTDGDHEARLVIQFQGERDAFEVEVQLRGRAHRPQIRVVPEAIDFGRVPAGNSAQAAVTAMNASSVPVTITELRLEGDPGFEAVPDTEIPATLPAGSQALLAVRYDADHDLPAHATVVIRHTDPGDPEIWVELSANDCTTSFDPSFDADGDGTVECAGDCDDMDPSIHPGAVEVCDGVDQDCDGVKDEGTGCYDDDGDGFAETEGDCNDGDPDVSPAEFEAANGIDDDCDGLIDEGVGAGDLDGDGYTEAGGDCLEGNADVYPGAPEVWDGLDNDCNGYVDDDPSSTDDDGDGWSEDEGDCHDGDPDIHPGAPPLHGADGDCDGVIDDGYDGDGDGWSTEAGDCDDADASARPGGAEVADGVDNDCDGAVDEGTPAFDDDGDGFSEDEGDCNDGLDDMWPGAVEVADGRDNDCDGGVDEGTAAFDDDVDGYTEDGGDCDDGDSGVHPGAAEIPGNGVDDDCDGDTD